MASFRTHSGFVSASRTRSKRTPIPKRRRAIATYPTVANTD